MRTKNSVFFKVHVSCSRYLQESVKEEVAGTVVGPLPTQEKTKEILMFVPWEGWRPASQFSSYGKQYIPTQYGDVDLHNLGTLKWNFLNLRLSIPSPT